MSEYAVVIRFNFEGESEQAIVLDTINDVRVNDSSQITEHPIVTGDMVADHMIREPSTMTIDGSLSISSSTPSVNSYLITNNKVDLIVSQEIFTRIKNEGVMCEIYKISVNDKNIRFMRRKNMVLNNISWTERINSVDFTFNFREVITADVQTYVEETSDSFLPNVTEPDESAFSEVLLDLDKVYDIIWQTCKETEVVTPQFIQDMHASVATGGFIGLGITIAVTLILKALAVAVSFVPVIGAIVAIAGAIIGALIFWLKSKKYKIKQFKDKNDIKRFGDFIEDIKKQLDVLNNEVKVYQVSENKEQECLITIDNNYYVFTFNKNNTSGKYSLKVLDLNDNLVGKIIDNVEGAIKDIGECTVNNCLFTTDGGTSVYLICPSDDEETRKDLTNYYILSSSRDLTTIYDVVSQLVKNAIVY